MTAIPLPPVILPDDPVRPAGLEAPSPALEVLYPDGGPPPAYEKSAAVLGRAAGFSEFITAACRRCPEEIRELIVSGDLLCSRKADACSKAARMAAEAASGEDDLMRRLRILRRREMIRIAVRDLGGLAGLNETCADLSRLAEACVDAALDRLHRWLTAEWGVPVSDDGTPQHLVVMGMGKLGARELNFSSDIDLIFLFPASGATTGGRRHLSCDEFFQRLGRRLMRVIGEATADGFVFRVDMNLRPLGESGPLAMNFDAAEQYFQEQGREWERYAWIKARCVAGDREAGAAFLSRLNRFVYRRYLDYGVFEAIRDMKGRIEAESVRRNLTGNIKLGPGGIREVEFFGQIFQLLRGGVDAALQERRILAVLDLLKEKGLIQEEVRTDLAAAYVFLRHAEHRLQAWGDAQTHDLPAASQALTRLARSLGFAAAGEFQAALKEVRRTVHLHFQNLLQPEKERHPGPAECMSPDASGPLHDIWCFPSEDEARLIRMTEAGYRDPARALAIIGNFKSEFDAMAISREGRERIHRFMPMAAAAAGRAESPELVLERIISLVKSVLTRTSYIALFLEKPRALVHLVRLADASGWILSAMTRHPLLLDELIDARLLYRPPSYPEMAADLDNRMAMIPDDDLERQMDELRVFRSVNILRVAAADITNAIPLMHVSDHLSHVAEIILDRVLVLAREQLARRHGLPPCDPPLTAGGGDESGFIIIAYGKLGGFELSYGSDLDLVFLHSGTAGMSSGGRTGIDAVTWFTRLGQRIIHLLSTATTLGRLYETDMRLRPDGESGVLVRHMDGFERYQMETAWIWEQQALVRARPVAGDPRLAARFGKIRTASLTRKRDPEKLRTAIREMRERMRQELLTKIDGKFDLKQGAGGMVDVEFLVQYLVLRHCRRHPEILRWTDNVRLIGELARVGALTPGESHLLRRALLCYRTTGHKLNLRELPQRIGPDRYPDLRREVSRIWQAYMGGS
ncbi:MAG: bifunctional [glutamate--ammonia ligase]-adenylyl-L-tyrosine phosphorylase/[glutamate--ammonia-ligase] adenylyltransferase [Desulfobacterales bacterium]|nr:MAG: bifunctional [glutamate--ammonia ligase]-adenylyl-L-tyrosine phosphorylase/[glutamate--ammonia-ligase] adenylyltransferase [Desulfobacterales bacterium]